jgi:hypothetical protein
MVRANTSGPSSTAVTAGSAPGARRRDTPAARGGSRPPRGARRTSRRDPRPQRGHSVDEREKVLRQATRAGGAGGAPRQIQTPLEEILAHRAWRAAKSRSPVIVVVCDRGPIWPDSGRLMPLHGALGQQLGRGADRPQGGAGVPRTEGPRVGLRSRGCRTPKYLPGWTCDPVCCSPVNGGAGLASLPSPLRSAGGTEAGRP